MKYLKQRPFCFQFSNYLLFLSMKINDSSKKYSIFAELYKKLCTMSKLYSLTVQFSLILLFTFLSFHGNSQNLEIIGDSYIHVECDEDYNLDYIPEITTDCPDGFTLNSEVFNTGELEQICTLENAFGPGDDWALWLPNLNIVDSDNFLFSEEGGTLEIYTNGTAHFYGEVYNAENSNQIFEISIWLENGTDWEDWTTGGVNNDGSFRYCKDDYGFAGDNYLDWTYKLVNLKKNTPLCFAL